MSVPMSVSSRTFMRVCCAAAGRHAIRIQTRGSTIRVRQVMAGEVARGVVLLRRELRRDRGDWPELDVAIENLRPLGLQDDRTRRHEGWHLAVDPHRAVEAHHDLAVHDVNGVLAEANQLDG